MKQFIDFIPLILFFIVYKLDPRTVELAGHSFSLGGIYSATAVLIASSVESSSRQLSAIRRLLTYVTAEICIIDLKKRQKALSLI